MEEEKKKKDPVLIRCAVITGEEATRGDGGQQHLLSSSPVGVLTCPLSGTPSPGLMKLSWCVEA